jgi:hypothetical protein
MEAMSSCKFCEFASICNAGCVENAYLIRQRLSDRDMYCAGYKQMFTHLRQALLAALDESSMQSCVSTGTEIVTILGREINVETVQNPALRRVIEQRICNTTISPMNWGEHKKWSEYYPDYKKHDKYSEYKKYEKYNEHSRTYNEHWKERWKEHKKYSDHYDHWQTPY